MSGLEGSETQDGARERTRCKAKDKPGVKRRDPPVKMQGRRRGLARRMEIPVTAPTGRPIPRPSAFICRACRSYTQRGYKNVVWALTKTSPCPSGGLMADRENLRDACCLQS